MPKALATVCTLTATLLVGLATTSAVADVVGSEIPPADTQAPIPVEVPPGASVASIQRRIEEIDATLAGLKSREGRLTRTLQRAGARLDAAERDLAKATWRLVRITEAQSDVSEVASRGVALVQATLRRAAAEQRARKLRKISLEQGDVSEIALDLRSRIARLEASRMEQVAIADQLRARDATAGDGTLTRAEWAELFLAHAGLPNCSENVALLVAWQTQEGTEAGWNPLATTLSMPGAGVFNSVGVRDYVSIGQGLEATRRTLTEGSPTYGYGGILESLRVCAPAETTAGFVNASAWCSNCTDGAYLTGLLPVVRADFAFYAAVPVGTNR